MNKASSKSKNQKSENDEEANTKSGQTIEMPDILGKRKRTYMLISRLITKRKHLKN